MSGTLWITGAAGFTGRHLVAFLRQHPERPRVVGLDLASDAPPGFDGYHGVDLTDCERVAGIAQDEPPTWVIHLAGAMPPTDESAMWHANVGGTVSLLQALRSAECAGARIVSIGSLAEYVLCGPEALDESAPCGGASPYGRTKWAQSLLALAIGRQFGIATLVARPSNLIGPGLPDRFVAGGLCSQFAHANGVSEIEIGNLESARDFVDVRDAVDAYWLLVRQGRAGEIYNVCSGRPTTVRQLLDHFSKVSGTNPSVRVDPARIRTADPSVVYGTFSKLQDETGWEPRISLRKSVEDMLAAAGHNANALR